MTDQPSHPWGRLLLVAVLVPVLLAGTLAVATGLGWLPDKTSDDAVDSASVLSTATGPERVTAGLVNIDTTLPDAAGAGSGIVLTPNGRVLTNNHVIEGATGITAVDVGNGHRYRADVVGYDRVHDIAVIQLVGASGLAVAPLGTSATLAVGDPITAVGNAGGRGGPPAQEPGAVAALHQTVSAGDESGDDPERLADVFEVQARVEPGDSGGAIVDAGGTVVGVTTAASRNARVRQAGGAGFAIPVDQARAIARQINGRGGPSIHQGPTAVLGVGVLDAAAERASASNGVMIEDVTPGSSAARAGLLPGDTITSLDGRAAASRNALTDSLQAHRPGDRVRISWIDVLGDTHQQTMALVAGPPA